MPWLLNLAYLLLLLAVSPVLLYRLVVRGKYRDGWAEKLLGRVPDRRRAGGLGERRCLWFHAVSVGEVLQLQTILKRLESALPRHEFLVTTTTITGYAVAREKFAGPRYRVCYQPLDFSWAVRSALRRIRPDVVVLVELELWPNFILAARRMGIPLMLVNGRISERSFRGYRRIRPLMRRLLGCFRSLAVQNDLYRERLIELGAPDERVTVTGSIKFDGVQTDRDNPRTVELRRAFGLKENERVFIAGSTQPPEEEYALDAWVTLREEFPDLRLILVPRHKERFEEVAALVRRRGLPLLRRTERMLGGEAEKGRGREGESERGEDDERGALTDEPGIPVAGRSSFITHRSSSFPSPLPQAPSCGTDLPVLLLDTLGELGACWGLADIAFVGGSLTNRGGQNMIEPAAYGAALLFGPNTWNFRDVVELLLEQEAARVVSDADELPAAVRQLLSDAELRNRRGRRARRLVLSQQGATDKAVELLLETVGRRPSPATEPAPRAA